jgi:hypothetical protein
VSPTVSLGLEIFSTVRAGEKRTMNTLDVKIEAGFPKENIRIRQMNQS